MTPSDRDAAAARLERLLTAMSRRRFLVGTSTLALTAACARGESPPPDGLDGGVLPDAAAPDAALPDAGSVDDDVFRVLADLRAAVRTSPDHLPARAAALVAAADARGLFALIRDEVATLPGAAENLGDLAQRQRWGPRAALRGAAGTPREKAELLAQLLREAGLVAEVRIGRAVESARDARGLFLRPHPQVFAPGAPVDGFAARARELGYDFTGAIPDVDPDGARARALAAQLAEAIEDRSDALAFDFDGWLSFEYLPVVEAEVAGARVVLNPADPAATWDEPRVDLERLTEAESPGPTLPVRVELEGTYVGNPEPVTLLESSYRADEIAGSQLVLRFLPLLPVAQWPLVRLDDAPAFTPLLAVQDVNRPQEALRELGAIGRALTLGGDRLTVEGGRAVVNGVALADPPTGIGPVEAVETLSMQLDTTGFPRVRAQLWPRDGEGRIVEGLTGAAFGLTDARASRGATLVANSATPRFRILLDVTASQPLDFIVTSAEDFIAELTATLRARFPLASIDFAESWDDWGVPVDASRGQTPPTHILWITDGGMTDVLTPEREAQLRAGPQVVIISTLADVDPLGAQMALLTGGRVLVAPQSDPATARSVGEEIAASLVPAGAPYVLTYDAQLDGPPERVCRVELMTSAVSAEATYTAPAEVDAFGQLVGLRLRVQVGDVVCVRRLAGPIDPSRASPRTPSELQAVRDELTSAMLGVTYLGVEGGFPTRAVWLDDLLQARLGKARLFGLLGTAEAEDADMVEGALAEAGVEIPLELFTYDTSLADTHGADGITFENGLRCVIARYQPWLGSRDLTVSLDILPTADVATASTGDAEAAFMRTLQRTAARAVREAAFYSRSTLGALEGRPLVWSAGPPGLGELSEQAAAEWQEALQGNLRHVVAAEGLEPLAYWSVTRFGEVLGVIGGGRGGGEEALVNEIMASLSRLDFVISSINLAAGPLGASGAVLVGVATLYGQFLARLYAGVAVVVATLDGSRLGPSLRSAVLNAACNALKGLVGLGGLRFGEFDYVLGLLFGASSPLNCAG